jgi:hypothetical protein
MSGRRLELHQIFPFLAGTCDILERHNIPYVLSGGTLLGAVRDGNIIAHDDDFDIDTLYDERERIMSLASEFEKIGLTINEKRVTLLDRAKNKIEVSGSKIDIRTEGRLGGDIYLFRVFNDGMARRIDDEGVYYNAKMSMPAWYYEGTTPVKIQDRIFPGPRSPELYLERVYGDDWRTSLKPGQYQKGRKSKSGAVRDSDNEKLVRHALLNGWDTDYSHREPWPRPIKIHNARLGERWAARHEPMLNKEMQPALDTELVLSIASNPSPFRIARFAEQAGARGLTFGLNRASLWRQRFKKLQRQLAVLKSKKAAKGGAGGFFSRLLRG